MGKRLDLNCLLVHYSSLSFSTQRNYKLVSIQFQIREALVWGNTGTKWLRIQDQGSKHKILRPTFSTTFGLVQAISFFTSVSFLLSSKRLAARILLKARPIKHNHPNTQRYQ